MPYAIYGKHTVPYKDKYGNVREADRDFRPLNAIGQRVGSPRYAKLYKTREQATYVLLRAGKKKGVELKVKKVHPIFDES